MTVPAQPTSSSTSTSGQAVTIAKDTVTQGTSATGLAGVLADADAEDVAAGIAQAISSHFPALAEKKIQEIRVIGDLSALGDITSLGIFTSQVTKLSAQITEYIRSVPQAAGGLKAVGVAAPLGIGDAVNALSTLAGTISQLVAGTYTYSGQAIPNASIGGLDILIARELTSKISVPVHVDRFAMLANSDILEQFQNLVTRAAQELNPALARAAAAAAAKAQIAAGDKDRISELDAEQTASQKGSSPDSGKLQEEYDKVSARLPGESDEAAEAQNLLAEGQALAAAITAFVTGALSTPVTGGPAPVTRAAHGERLSKDGTAILYAQVIAAGDDQVLRQTLIHNTWSNLTGLTAEYALLMQGEEALAFGLESSLAVAHGSIREGLTDITRKRVALRAK
jgi:hypothetical protein